MVALAETGDGSYRMYYDDPSGKFKFSHAPNDGSAFIDYLSLSAVVDHYATTLNTYSGGLGFDGGKMMINGTTSSLNVEGGTDSTLTVSAQMNASCFLNTGSNSVAIQMASATSMSFNSISSSTTALITLDTAADTFGVQGSVEVASLSSVGVKTVTVSSADKAAAVTVHAGSVSNAYLSVTSPDAQTSSFSLKSGTRSWRVQNEASSNTLNIDYSSTNSGETCWLSISDSKSSFMQDLTALGNLSVGSQDSSTPVQLSLISSDSTASLTVEAKTAATMTIISTQSNENTLLTVTSANTRDASLTLTTGANLFKVGMRGSSDQLVITDTSSNNLFQLSKIAGDANVRGGLNVKTNSLLVTRDGFVGLNNANPLVALSVSSTASTTGPTGVKVDGSSSSNQFQVLTAGANIQNGLAISVDTVASQVGIGTSTPESALHIVGSLRIEDYNPQFGDLTVTDGTVHLPYLAHDDTESIGGLSYFCMKIGEDAVAPTTQVGMPCSTSCGGASPEAACTPSTCGTNGWCTNKGLHNHYYIVTETDVFLPDVSEVFDQFRTYTIIFKKVGNETGRYIIGVGDTDPEDGSTDWKQYYNPACQSYILLNRIPLPNTKVFVAFKSTSSTMFASCSYSGSLWRCVTYVGGQ